MTTVTTTDLGPLDPCYSITRAANRRTVHVRHPRDERLTLCGKTIGWDLHPEAGTPVGCSDCRVTARMIRDRVARNLPELCLQWSREGFGSWRKTIRCVEPIEGHRQRPDTGYPSPWHTGVDLPPDWDAPDSDSP